MAMDTTVDGNLADKEWLRRWGTVRQVFNLVVRAEDPKTRWKGKHRYRRLLNGMAEIRQGRTELGDCTHYSDEWVRAAALKRQAQEDTRVQGPFSLAAAEPVALEAGVQSRELTVAEEKAVPALVPRMVLWQSTYNHQPDLVPPVGLHAPAGVTLH